MNGNLDQTCPYCGITEAAGAYCTKCIRPTQEAWIHPAVRSDAQRHALAAVRAKGSPRAANQRPTP